MTDDSFDAHRLRKAFAATTSDRTPSGDCPPAETVWRAVHAKLDSRELETLLEHLTACGACTEDWRLAAEIGHAEPLEAAPAPARELAMSSAGTRAARLSAAAAVLAFLAFDLAHHELWPGLSIARATGDRDPILALAAPPNRPSSGECELRWTEFDGSTYDALVLGDRLEPIFEARGLAEPRLELPAAILSELPEAAELRLYLEVNRGLDGVLAQRTFHFRCRGE